jgi:hypothetical protein
MFKQLQMYLNKLLKLKYNFNPVLQNRIVLYFFFIVALIDMVYFLNIRDFYSFATLFLVGFLTTFFSKNMIVVLFTALLVTHVLKYGKSSYEGLDNMDNDNDDAESESPKKKDKELVGDSDSSGEEKIEYGELKKDFTDFQGVQNKILSGLREIDPLLQKAEDFIKKFEGYKNQQTQDALQNRNYEGLTDKPKK